MTSGTPLSRSETPSTSPEPDVKTEEVAADAGRVKSEDPEEELQLVPVKEAEREDVKPVAIARERRQRSLPALSSYLSLSLTRQRHTQLALCQSLASTEEEGQGGDEGGGGG